jgi:hypothetical protein
MFWPVTFTVLFLSWGIYWSVSHIIDLKERTSKLEGNVLHLQKEIRR